MSSRSRSASLALNCSISLLLESKPGTRRHVSVVLTRRSSRGGCNANAHRRIVSMLVFAGIPAGYARGGMHGSSHSAMMAPANPSVPPSLTPDPRLTGGAPLPSQLPRAQANGNLLKGVSLAPDAEEAKVDRIVKASVAVADRQGAESVALGNASLIAPGRAAFTMACIAHSDLLEYHHHRAGGSHPGVLEPAFRASPWEVSRQLPQSTQNPSRDRQKLCFLGIARPRNLGEQNVDWLAALVGQEYDAAHCDR